MSEQSHRDHGVTGRSHWLLDEELASRSKGQGRVVVPTPALLLHENVLPVPRATGKTAEVPPRRHFVPLLAAMVAAVLVYALLRSADVGSALEEVLADDNGGAFRVPASLDEPGAREVADLRSLLALTRGATIEVPGAQDAQARPKKPKSSKQPGSGSDDGVLPPLPPPPPPLIPEINVPEIPGVEVPKLPEVPVLERPSVPELLEPVTGSQLLDLP